MNEQIRGSRWDFVKAVIKEESTLTVGIIGLGVMGRRMLSQMSAHLDFVVKYAWDESVSQCQEIWEEHPNIQIAENAEELVRFDDIDVVYIATPPGSHIEYAELAIERGKSAFVEKPLAIDTLSAAELVEDASLSRAPTAVNFTFASSPAFHAVRNAMITGAVGNPIRIEIILRFAKWPREWQESAAWLKRRAEGGFAREVFSHFCFLTMRMFGWPIVNRSVVVYGDDEDAAETSIDASLSCGGIPVTLRGDVGEVEEDVVQWVVHGSRASYRIDNWNIVEVMEFGSDDWEEIDMSRWHVYPSQLDMLSSMLRGEDHTLPSLEEALAVQRIVEELLTGGGMYRAAEDESAISEPFEANPSE